MYKDSFIDATSCVSQLLKLTQCQRSDTELCSVCVLNYKQPEELKYV